MDAEIKIRTDSFAAFVQCFGKTAASDGYQISFETESWFGTASFSEETITSIQSCADIPMGQSKGSKRTRLLDFTSRTK